MAAAQEVLLEGPVVAQADGEQLGGLWDGLGPDQIATVGRKEEGSMGQGLTPVKAMIQVWQPQACWHAGFTRPWWPFKVRAMA